MQIELSLWNNHFAHTDFSTLTLEGDTQLPAPHPAAADHEPFGVTPMLFQGIGRTLTLLCLVLALNSI